MISWLEWHFLTKTTKTMKNFPRSKDHIYLKMEEKNLCIEEDKVNSKSPHDLARDEYKSYKGV